MKNRPQPAWTAARVLRTFDGPNADYNIERAIVALYTRQTAQEQAQGGTLHDNAIGFNGPDGGKLSYYARWLSSGRHLDGKFKDDAHQRIRKYARQIADLANEAVAA
jgi:hypothetical protein